MGRRTPSPAWRGEDGASCHVPDSVGGARMSVVDADVRLRGRVNGYVAHLHSGVHLHA